MIITGGIYKGRKLKTVKGDTVRCSTALFKESLFNILTARVNIDSFLDLFAGSGSVGIEALSRGAKKVIFVEKNSNNANLICSNISLLGAEKEIKVMNILAEKAIGLLKNSQFDVIFIDPPYELVKPPYIKEIFQLITDHNVLSENGYLVLEYPAYDEPEIFQIDDLELVKSKNYGKSGLAIWVQKSVSE